MRIRVRMYYLLLRARDVLCELEAAIEWHAHVERERERARSSFSFGDNARALQRRQRRRTGALLCPSSPQGDIMRAFLLHARVTSRTEKLCFSAESFATRCALSKRRDYLGPISLHRVSFDDSSRLGRFISSASSCGPC